MSKSQSPALWVVALVTLIVFGITALSEPVLSDGDTWWHVKAGQWILAHGSVPRVDPFVTWSPGRPWVPHEWFAEVLMALAFQLADWRGVLLLTGLAIATAFALLAMRLARDLDWPALACCLLLVLSLVASGLLARPHIFALPVLVAWAIGLLQARDHDRAPSLLLLPLMTLWANLHGGYAFGLALIGPFALEALVEAPAASRWRVVRGWALFGIGALAASLVTPLGIDGLLFPFKLISMKSIRLISEWQPVNFATLQPIAIVILAVLFVSLRYSVKVPVVRLLLLLGLVHMSFGQARHQMLLGIIGSLVLAAPLGRALGEQGLAAQSLGRARLRGGGPAAASLLTGLVVLAGLRLAMPITRGDGRTAPITAMAAVPDSLRRMPVLNGYAFGSYLIWIGVEPLIDSRADMYGDEAMFAYQRLVQPDPAELDAALARSNAQWTIFEPSEPLVALLDRKPGWRRLHTDPTAVVHEKVPGS
jgi:hypothetical protein